MAQKYTSKHTTTNGEPRERVRIHGSSFTRNNTEDHSSGGTNQSDGDRPDFIKWMEQLRKKVKTLELKERAEAKQYGNR